MGGHCSSDRRRYNIGELKDRFLIRLVVVQKLKEDIQLGKDCYHGLDETIRFILVRRLVWIEAWLEDDVEFCDLLIV